MNLRVVPLEESLEARYANFLGGLPEAMVYYSSRFREYIREVTGGSPEYYVALDDEGRVRGVLPLFFRDGSYGRVYNSLPFYGSHGGVLYDAPGAAALLMDQYAAVLREANVVASTIVGNPLQPESLPPPFDLLDTRIGQFTRIAGGTPDSLMERFHQKTRNMIRKAQKSGVEVSVDASAIDFLRITHEENLATLGGMAKPRLFFEALPRHFHEGCDYRIYVASNAGRMIAALLLFYYGKTVEYYTPAIANAFRSLQPMSAIIYRAMCDAARDGYELWNWGGTWSSQEGVYRFKKRWDAEDRPYTYFVKAIDPSILHRSKQELLDGYPWFFVVPFSALTTEVETGKAS